MLSAESINFASNLIPVGGRKLNSLDLLLVAELQLLACTANHFNRIASIVWLSLSLFNLKRNFRTLFLFKLKLRFSK